jgi:hypothetical protein
VSIYGPASDRRRTRDLHGVTLPWGAVRHFARATGQTDNTVRASVRLGHVVVDETGTRLVPVSSPSTKPQTTAERFAVECDELRTRIGRVFYRCPPDQLEGVVNQLVTEIKIAFGELARSRIQRDRGAHNDRKGARHGQG